MSDDELLEATLQGGGEQDALLDVDDPDSDERSSGGASRLRLLVHFKRVEDLRTFSRLVGQVVGLQTKVISFPVGGCSISSGLDEDILSVEQQDLVEVPENWHRVWRGMPAYENDDLTAIHTVEVHCATHARRAELARLTGNSVTAETKSVWFPRAEVDEVIDLRWRSTHPLNPKYPVYVPTKGRWESAYTIKCLERLGVPYFAVVQPQERERYEAVVKTGTMLLLPQGLDGLVPARNWIFEHAVRAGAERHWQLDDNIKSFFRYHENRQIHVADGTCMRIAEDFVDRYENVAIAGFQYFMFVPRKQGNFPPYVFNTRVYSNSLINNSIPYRYRGVYNDDTDICLRALKEGWCTVQFNAFLAWKQPTMKVAGGNTPIYLGAERVNADWASHVKSCRQCSYDVNPTSCKEGRAILEHDGRWRMAESLRDQHPDVTTVVRKWNRWQHQVDYRRFKRNVPVLRDGVTLPDANDEYGLQLTEVLPGEELCAMPVNEGERSSKSTSGLPPGPSVLDFIKQLTEAQPGQPKPPAQPPESIQGEGGTPDALAFAASFRARGHRLLTRDGRFFVSEANRLSDEDRATIRQHREQLIQLAEPWSEGREKEESEGTKEGQTQKSEDDSQDRQSDVAERLSAGTLRPGELLPEVTTLFPEPATQTLAQFLGDAPLASVDPNFVPDAPPDLSGIGEVVLNFATTGLDWHAGAKAAGLTVSTLDGKLCRFLPFGFIGGNLDEEVVRRWAREQLRGKKVYNSKTKFDVHVAREWGVDLEEQGCTFSDIQHTAALLDDHRKRFALDVLAADYFPGEQFAARVDESRHAEHHASEVAERERTTARLVGRLHAVMYPQLDEQELRAVQKLEDDCIPAVVEMERNGSPLDLELLEQYHAEALRRHDELLWEVAKECGFAFDHTAKGWQRLFEVLGLPPTDGNDESIVGAIDHPIVRKAHLAAQYASLDSKTFKAYRENVGSDGVLRFEVNQLRNDEGGTVSGRFSIGYVQQVPNHDNHSAVFGEDLFPRRLFRPKAFVRDDGSEAEYLEADAAQVEYRLFAHFANNQQVLAAYAADPWLSFHKVTWEMMKRYKPDMLYSHQKSFNFAKQYGARSIKLAVMMGFITEAEGDEIRAAKAWSDPRLKTIKEVEAAYRQMMPEGDLLLERAAHLAKPACDNYCRQGDALHRQWPHRGYVRTLDGRRSRFPTNYKTYIGLNRVLQGTGADVMKRKLAELHRERKRTGFVMRLTIHDAVGGDATSPETLKLVKEILNEQTTPTKVPILWECKAGRNWAECK